MTRRIQIRRLLALSVDDWRLLAAASSFELAMCVLVRIAPMSVLRRLTMTPGRAVRAVTRLAFRGPDDRVLWAIDAAGRRLGSAGTCLVRALVAALALGWRTRTLRLHIGVRHGNDGSLESHAWLTDDGRVLVGGADANERFAPMVAWGGSSS